MVDTASKKVNYTGQFKKEIDSKNLGVLSKLVQKLSSEQVSSVESKPALSYLASTLRSFNNIDCKNLCKATIEALASKASYFKKEDAMFKRELASICSAQDDPWEAMKLMKEIKYEAMEESVDAESAKPEELALAKEKIEDFLTTCEYCFEADDATAAEGWINKCAHLMHLEPNPEQKRRFAFLKARCDDCKRKFQEAAQAFIRLVKSVDPATATEEEKEDAETLMNYAITCAILAPAGPQKAITLTTLVRDERHKTQKFAELLNKMYKQELLRDEDVAAFQNDLKDHQKVKFADGQTVLDRARMEHNIVVLSKIYMNITFKELGKFLGIPTERAETIVAKLVGENRINAVLDQQNELVEFEDETNTMQTQGTFNQQIQTVCEGVDSLMRDIIKKHPETQAKYDIFKY